MLLLLMEVLDLTTFLSFKNNEEVQNLDSQVLELFTSLFGGFDKNKKNKKSNKTNVNILKNQKIQNKKDSMVNRVNLILNKLSESNIESLITEFLDNINQVDLENFEEIQKAFYLKIISEINFIKIYLQFLKVIGFLYNKVQNYDLLYFYNMIETKFKSDYLDRRIEDEKYSFINELEGEGKRINNLTLIKYFIENKFVNSTLIDSCDSIIINQVKYLPDIYYWFNSRNRDLTADESTIIKNYLTNSSILQREKVLLESLINKNMVKKDIPDTIKKVIKPINNTDTLKLECDNIIEEYILLKSYDDVSFFIEKRCVDAISKNKFCEQLIDKYFLSNKENAVEIIELIKQLIKSQVLFKSNLSRGLLLINNNWKERSIDYSKSSEKMKTFLTTLKSIGITKGLEHLLDLYNIEV